MISCVYLFYTMFTFLTNFLGKYFVSFCTPSNSSEDLLKTESHANPIHEENKELLEKEENKEEEPKKETIRKVHSWENFYMSFLTRP